MTTQQREVTKAQLNASVLALVKLDRAKAVAILAKHGVLNTTQLQPEAWRPVFEACEEARSKIASNL